MNRPLGLTAVLLLLPAAIHAGTIPTFDNRVFKVNQALIPASNTHYTDIQFRRGADGRWDLIQALPTSMAVVESIDIVTMESFPSPVQIVAAVNGYLEDGCTSLGAAIVQRIDATFHVILPKQRPVDAICAQVVTPYDESIPLDVVGLDAGLYTVRVNDKSASFELDANSSPDAVCCRAWCCTCGPEFQQSIYSRMDRNSCRRPEGIVGGSCYEIVDSSHCAGE